MPVAFERTRNPHWTQDGEDYGAYLRELRLAREAKQAEADAADREVPLDVVQRATPIALADLERSASNRVTSLQQVAQHVADDEADYSLQRGKIRVPASYYAADTKDGLHSKGDLKKSAQEVTIFGLGCAVRFEGVPLFSFVAYWEQPNDGPLTFQNARCSDAVLGVTIAETITELKDWLGIFIPWPVKAPPKKRAPKKTQDEILLEGGEWHG